MNTGDTDTLEAAPAPRRRRFRPWRWLVAMLLLAVVLLIAGAGFLLGTEAGLRSAYRGVHHLAPGLITVGRLEGSVLGGPVLEGIALELPAARVGIRRLALDWRPARLLEGELHVVALEVEGTEVALRETDEEAPPLDELPTVALPVRLVLERLQLNGLAVTPPGAAEPMVIDSLVLAADWAGTDLAIGTLEIVAAQPAGEAKLDGRVALAGDYPLAADLQWRFDLTGELPLEGEGRVEGDLERLGVVHRTTGAVRSEFEGELSALLEAPEWGGRLDVRELSPRAFAPGAPPGLVSASLTGEGTFDRFSLDGELAADLDDFAELGRLEARLQAALADGVLEVPSLTLTTGATNMEVRAGGRYRIGGERQGAWSAHVDVQDLSPGAFVGGVPPGLVGGSFRGEGTLESFSLEGELAADLDDFPELGQLRAQLRAELADQLLRVPSLTLTTGDTAMTLQADGRYRLGGDGAGAFEARARWQALGWPAGDVPRYRLPQGTLEASGTLDDFVHVLGTRLEGTGLPAADVHWQGHGNRGSLTFESLSVETLDGRVDGTGQVAWSPDVTWSLDLAAADLQPSAQWPEFGGRLGARLATTGRLAEQLEASVELASLDGELQGRPVAGHGLVRLHNGTLAIDDLALNAGPNRVNMAGTVGETLAVDADVDAPDLSVLLPEAAGELRLEARVGGRLERPEVEGTLAVRELRFAGLALASADGRLQVAADRDGVLDVDLRAAGLKAGALAWQDVAVVAGGTPAAHRFSLALDGEPLALEAEGDGAWREDGRYAGNLRVLGVESTEAGGWRLDRPVAFAAGPGAWELQQLCLSSTQDFGGGCVAASGAGGSGWQVDAEVPRLDLGAFASFVPEGIVVEGQVRASARLAAEGNRLTGEARLDVPSGTSRVDFDEADQVLDFSGAGVNLKATGGDLSADLELPLAGLGRIQAQASLPGWRLDAPARADQAVGATLKGRIPDLGPLNAVVPQVDELRGSADADLKLSGTLGNARLDGQIEVAGMAFEVPAAGVQVSELSLAARSRSAGLLEYTGSARIGSGKIELAGKTGFAGPGGATTSLTIQGEKLTVVDVPEATLVVSPDLVFSVEERLARLTGELVVPEARLRPRGIPAGSVSPSDDVVIKDETDEDGNLRLLTAADIRLKFGDRVSFEGFGLRGLIRGDLRITQEPGRLALGNGQLGISDGTFATFGEELKIDQGRLVFANTPVYNPAMNIVASREFTEATVGARVSGTLKKPQVTFFSDPPMGQAEALNYLLTGGASSRGSATSGAAVVGGNLLVKEFGRQVGLDNIGVTQQEDSDDLSLYVGTYLTPQLYMQYVNEMGEQANKVRLRYDLTKKIQLEAETGDVQSVNVFYKFERK